MDNKTVFRDKAIERISSPEQLNDYVKLTNPGVWFILAAIMLILTGACIFGVFGHIDSTVPAVTVSDGKEAFCFVKREYEDRFNDGMRIKIRKNLYNINFEDRKPIALGDLSDSYALYLGSMQKGEWVYEFELKEAPPEGIFESDLIIERISPLSFLFGKK